MAKHNKKAVTVGKTPKRGFAVLDREASVTSALGALHILRSLPKCAFCTAADRLSVNYAIGQVERELNTMLCFSSSGHLPGERAEKTEPLTGHLGEARKAAAGAVKVLRKILKGARADLSVDENDSTKLDFAIDGLEVALNDLLPPPGAPPKARLPGFDDDDDDDGGAAESSLESKHE